MANYLHSELMKVITAVAIICNSFLFLFRALELGVATQVLKEPLQNALTHIIKKKP